MVVIFTVNALSVRWFAEAEFWFASIKVIAIIAFIILGGLAMFGLLPLHGHASAPFSAIILAMAGFLTASVVSSPPC